MSDTIKEKLSKIKDLNHDVYDILINDKLEFDRLTRLKKSIKQSLKKHKVGGLKAAFNKPNIKKLVDRINTPSSKKRYFTSRLPHPSICCARVYMFEKMVTMRQFFFSSYGKSVDAQAHGKTL